MLKRSRPAPVLSYSTELVLSSRLSLWHFYISSPGLFLVGAGIFLGLSHAPTYWLCSVIIGLSYLVGVFMLTRPAANQIRLGDAGFTLRHSFTCMEFRWDDVASIDTVPVQRSTDMVGIRCITDPKHRKLSRQQ